MDWTDVDKATLWAHIVTGATLVQYGDRRVQYGSVDEMMKLWTWLESRETAAILASSGMGPQRRSFVTFSRR